MDYKILHRVIDLLELFEKENSFIDRNDNFERSFSLWLLSKSERPNSQNLKTFEENVNLEGNIGRLLVFLGRYVDFYSKRLFKYTDIYSINDFGYLMTLFPDKSITKSELNDSNLMEKSSGNEIIKRLLKAELIEEKIFSKKHIEVSLSSKGQTELKRIMKSIDPLSKHVVGDLTKEERVIFLQLMTRLHIFHKPIFDKKDEDNISKILNIESIKK